MGHFLNVKNISASLIVVGTVLFNFYTVKSEFGEIAFPGELVEEKTLTSTAWS